jgi:hypothetical protein
MIRTKTVFVIGAGAGADIGMPLGDKLSGIIGKKLDIKFEHGYKQISGDQLIMDALGRIAKEQGIDSNIYRQAGVGVASGVIYSRSIDSYLNAHTGNEAVKVCAKLAIVRSILEAEGQSAVFIDQRQAKLEFRNMDMVRKSWLQPFMFLLQDRIRKDENLGEIFKNVKIINFNYDRCIEQFLWLALQDLFLIPQDRAAELISSLPIIHPYGVVGSLPWQKGLNVGFGEDPHSTKLIEASRKIRTFNEQMEDEKVTDTISDWMTWADRVIFLGSHYHEQNMELLKAKGPHSNNGVPMFCTAYERSESDLKIIDAGLRKIMGARGPIEVFIRRDWDCSALFKEFGAVFAQ